MVVSEPTGHVLPGLTLRRDRLTTNTVEILSEGGQRTYA